MSCPTEEQKGGKIPHLLLRENLQEAEAHLVSQMSGLLAGKQTASVGTVVSYKIDDCFPSVPSKLFINSKHFQEKIGERFGQPFPANCP